MACSLVPTVTIYGTTQLDSLTSYAVAATALVPTTDWAGAPSTSTSLGYAWTTQTVRATSIVAQETRYGTSCPADAAGSGAALASGASYGSEASAGSDGSDGSDGSAGSAGSIPAPSTAGAAPTSAAQSSTTAPDTTTAASADTSAPWSSPLPAWSTASSTSIGAFSAAVSSSTSAAPSSAATVKPGSPSSSSPAAAAISPTAATTSPLSSKPSTPLSVSASASAAAALSSAPPASTHSNAGAIAGGVLGALVAALALAALALFLCRRRRRRRRRQAPDEGGDEKEAYWERRFRALEDGEAGSTRRLHLTLDLSRGAAGSRMSRLSLWSRLTAATAGTAATAATAGTTATGRTAASRSTYGYGGSDEACAPAPAPLMRSSSGGTLASFSSAAGTFGTARTADDDAAWEVGLAYAPDWGESPAPPRATLPEPGAEAGGARGRASWARRMSARLRPKTSTAGAPPTPRAAGDVGRAGGELEWIRSLAPDDDAAVGVAAPLVPLLPPPAPPAPPAPTSYAAYPHPADAAHALARQTAAWEAESAESPGPATADGGRYPLPPSRAAYPDAGVRALTPARSLSSLSSASTSTRRTQRTPRPPLSPPSPAPLVPLPPPPSARPATTRARAPALGLGPAQPGQWGDDALRAIDGAARAGLAPASRDAALGGGAWSDEDTETGGGGEDGDGEGSAASEEGQEDDGQEYNESTDGAYEDAEDAEHAEDADHAEDSGSDGGIEELRRGWE